MTREELLALREDTDFEAKLAQGRDGQGELPQSIWHTYSAMANTAGGRILLGAREEKDGSLTPKGIGDPRRVLKTLWDNLNNRQIISHTLLRDDDVEVLDVEDLDKPVILITIPAATRSQRPVYVGENPLTGTYRRSFEGDYQCDEATVRRMLAEAERDTRDDEVLAGFSLEDLDPDSLAAYRHLFRTTRPGHPWLTLDDRELLRRLGGWMRNRDRGVEGLTLAGLLMFGQLHTIREEVQTYLLDYQERLDPRVRWTDRITTDGTRSGNLFDFYRRVYPRLTQDLKVPFRLEGGAQRVDETPVHEALREALVNTLIHADYRQSTGILVVRYPDRFEFRNPGGLRIPRTLALQGGVSDSRNRNLQKMFQMIGAGEQAGSGVPRILDAWREQHWQAPLLEEHEEPERTTLRLTMISLLPPEVLDELERRYGGEFPSLSEIERLALATARIEGQVTNERLREITGAHPSDLTILLRRLVEGGYLTRHGTRRGSYYQLTAGKKPSATLFDTVEEKTGVRLSDRQRVAIELAEERGSFSREEYEKEVKISPRNAMRDLASLVEKGVLSRIGKGRATRYSLSSLLEHQK